MLKEHPVAMPGIVEHHLTPSQEIEAQLNYMNTAT